MPSQRAPLAPRVAAVESGNPISLSPRELEAVRLVVEGLSNQQIAERLGVSSRTIHAHLSSAMNKTGTSTRTQLAVYALRTGLVPLLAPEVGDD